MKSARAVVAAVGLSIGSGAAMAQSPAGLTPQAEARGFVLATYISGFSSDHAPVGIAFREDGQVLISEDGGSILRFPSHADAWTYADGVEIALSAYDFAQFQLGTGYRTFISQPQLDRIVEITPDAVIEGATFLDLPHVTSMAEVPAGTRGPMAGHLLAACAVGIYDIGPFQNPIVRRVSEDRVYGMQVSRDGAFLLAAVEDSVRFYDLATGEMNFDTLPAGPIAGGVRDVVQGVGVLAGQIYVNTAGGDLWEISLSDPAQRTLIVTGGAASSFLTPDPAAPGPDFGRNLPSLLICRADEILRLSLREGGFFSPFGPYCPADTDLDGLVDFSDYLEFLNRYDSLDPRADLNGDDTVDFADYLEFLNHYDLGC